MKHFFILITVLFSAFQINAQTLTADVNKSKII